MIPSSGRSPAGMRGVVNDAIALNLREVAFAAAIVARWCRPAKDGWLPATLGRAGPALFRLAPDTLKALPGGPKRAGRAAKIKLARAANRTHVH
jgi:hypothetical protein